MALGSMDRGRLEEIAGTVAGVVAVAGIGKVVEGAVEAGEGVSKTCTFSTTRTRTCHHRA